jgi:hypothetical protein
MRRLVSLVLVCGCSGSAPSPWIDGFNPPELQAGYTRMVPPIIKNIVPGSDIEYCQWALAPSDKDRDILDLIGSQSHPGHHGILYATTDTSYAVGETHVCTEDDMLHISFLGAIGGEGVAGSLSKLPEGLYFRLPAGQALMANTHWVNAGTKTLDGQAVFDVKFAEPDSSRTVADLFANNAASFTLPTGQVTDYDVTCTLQSDLSLAMSANHMHTHGVSAYTELIHADGSKTMIVKDDTWTGDEQFNPKYVTFGIGGAIQAKKGDVYHTHCQWDNESGKTLAFPSEMCTGFSFYFPSVGQIACVDGSWP